MGKSHQHLHNKTTDQPTGGWAYKITSSVFSERNCFLFCCFTYRFWVSRKHRGTCSDEKNKKCSYCRFPCSCKGVWGVVKENIPRSNNSNFIQKQTTAIGANLFVEGSTLKTVASSFVLNSPQPHPHQSQDQGTLKMLPVSNSSCFFLMSPKRENGKSLREHGDHVFWSTISFLSRFEIRTHTLKRESF